MTNRISPPNVKVTLSGIIYDVFWQFAPLTYSESYQEPYNEVLKEWLDRADLLFTISQKTKDDVLKVFPNATYASKLKAVPLAGLIEQSNPKHFKKHYRRLRKAKKNLSRKQKGSKNREKARIKVAKIHAQWQ